MTFEEAVATQPQWIQYWLLWMGLVVFISPLILLFSKHTRIDVVIIYMTNIVIYGVMMWLYQQVGYVRLLGIVHVIFWTPLVFYLWKRLADPNIKAPFRQVIVLIIMTIIVSLAFDYVDVARYLMGETASLVH